MQLPQIVLGCGNFGGIGSAPEFFGRGESKEEAFALLDAAWALGLDWLDTADAYGGGRSEAWIGEWVRAGGRRPRVTTKTYNPTVAGGDRGLRPERVHRQARASLEQLELERIDLYLAHDWDPETPIAETVGAFEELREEGVIAAWGLSNVGAGELRETLEHGVPEVVQNSYSLLDRRDESDVVPLCLEHRIAYQAFSPLAGGWLTGKYRRGEPPPEGSRMTLRPEPYAHLDEDGVHDGLDALAERARARGVSTAGLALAWVTSGVSAVIGPRRPAHLEPVREAQALRLSPGEREELRSLFR